MYRLSWIIVILCASSYQSLAQSPHGQKLVEKCNVCHNEDSWNINIDTFNYNHSSHDFDLSGTHLVTDCKNCHSSLVFENVQNSCISCHEDIHNQSFGNDCIRCHTSSNWLIDNIPEIHEQNGFPLEGGHFGLNCIECHQSETLLKFERIGNECVSCHLESFNETTAPNHILAGFSTDCVLCHDPLLSGDWKDASHFFFPLTKGHDTQDCNLCHTSDQYNQLSPDCLSCHEDDFNRTSNPSHLIGQFSTNCIDCHTTDINWNPVKFNNHDDLYFPIYSGKHNGEWSNCDECHTISNDYSLFNCLECHEHNDPNDLAGEHDDVKNYEYSSTACFTCHPK